jgi:hypothetical protein
MEAHWLRSPRSTIARSPEPTIDEYRPLWRPQFDHQPVSPAQPPTKSNFRAIYAHFFDLVAALSWNGVEGHESLASRGLKQLGERRYASRAASPPPRVPRPTPVEGGL